MDTYLKGAEKAVNVTRKIPFTGSLTKTMDEYLTSAR